jgi:hypothetical protein
MSTSRHLSALLSALLCLCCIVPATPAQTIGSPANSLAPSPAVGAATAGSTTTTTALPGGSLSSLQLGAAGSNLAVTTGSPTTAASPLSNGASTLSAPTSAGMATPATASNGSSAAIASAPSPVGATVGAAAPRWLECPASDFSTVDAALTGSAMTCAP